MDRKPKPGELYRHFKNELYQVIAIAVHTETNERLVIYQAMYGSFGIYARPFSQFVSEVDHVKYPQVSQKYRFEKVEPERAVQEASLETGAFGQKERPKEGSDWHTGMAAEIQSLKNAQNSLIDRYAEQQTEADYGAGGAQAKGVRQQTEANDGENGAAENGSNTGWHAEDNTDRSKADSPAVEKPEFVHGLRRPGLRPRTQSPAESKRAQRQVEAAEEDSDDFRRRRRQMEEREQRRELFRKQERHESATEELRANPNLLKFLDTETYEEKYRVLNEIQNDITDRLIDDIAVVLDVVIPEGPLGDRFYQLKNIVLTRQKYEISRFRR